MLLETLLKSPGFLYEIDGNYYYLGKWICKKCTNTDAADCAVMYHICRKAKEEPDTNIYFQKIRAYSDFALEVPYNPEKIKTDIDSLIKELSKRTAEELNAQIQNFTEDLNKYCQSDKTRH